MVHRQSGRGRARGRGADAPTWPQNGALLDDIERPESPTSSSSASSPVGRAATVVPARSVVTRSMAREAEAAQFDHADEHAGNNDDAASEPASTLSGALSQVDPKVRRVNSRTDATSPEPR